MYWILQLLMYGLSVYLAAYFLPGVEVESYQTALLVAAGLWIVNKTIRPIFTFLTIPISVLTLGIFYIFINALMISLVAYLIDGFTISSSILWAFVLGITLSILNSIFDKLIGTQKQKRKRQLGK